MEAFQMVLDDVRVSPHIMIESLLKQCLNKDRDVDLVEYRELERFFEDFESYFQ